MDLSLWPDLDGIAALSVQLILLKGLILLNFSLTGYPMDLIKGAKLHELFLLGI